ncbi:MAG: hypothetical protein P8M34_05540 [Saprospiraceae bacterium]|nr:hypothetical protein [Saprospiraceae bacterium]
MTIAGAVILASNLNTITESLVINANGLVIDGQTSFRGLDINGSMNVTINEITLRQFSGGDGPALISHTGMTTVNKGIFVANSGSKGGAVRNNAKLNFYLTEFVQNTSTGEGGAIFNKGTLDITR